MLALMNKIGNVFMKPLLRSPLHFLASGSVLLITFTGRKSGRVFTTPVMYKREGRVLIVTSQNDHLWWKNLQDNAPITVRLCGRDIATAADVVNGDKTASLEALQLMYPRMSVKKATELASICVVIRIHLPQTEAVRAV